MYFPFLIIKKKKESCRLNFNRQFIRYPITILLLLLLAFRTEARQTIDTVSIPVGDTSIVPAESVAVELRDTVDHERIEERPAAGLSLEQMDMQSPLLPQIWDRHPYFAFGKKPELRPDHHKTFHGKETLFYVVLALLLFFALLRNAFAKYFSDLFRVFFRTTMKQRQIRDQLMQTPLPSLLFNFFFVASAGLYLNFLLFDYLKYRPVENFWTLYLYVVLGLAAIYFAKFISLKLVGWIFNVRKAADSYIFVVFIINKVLGVFLLPFVVLLAFAQEPLYSIALLLSWVGLAGLFLYRYMLGWAAARNEVRFNLFHFLLYIAAFEVAPLLLIYRVLIFRF